MEGCLFPPQPFLHCQLPQWKSRTRATWKETTKQHTMMCLMLIILLLLRRSLHSPTCSDQCWSELCICLSPAILAGKQLRDGPLSADQHWSECSALSKLISAEPLKAVLSAEQCWTELSDAEQNRVTLNRTEWHWTEPNFRSVEQSLLLKKIFAHTRNRTLSLVEDVTWPKTRNIQLHHAAL